MGSKDWDIMSEDQESLIGFNLNKYSEKVTGKSEALEASSDFT